MKEQHIELEDFMKVDLPGAMFPVGSDNHHFVLDTVGGTLRHRFVCRTVGGRVNLERSPWDLDKARLAWRLR